MNEVAESQGTLPALQEPRQVAVSESVAFIQMIERASRDPSVDVDKMERLMQMHERMVANKAAADFNDAMTACQKEMSAVTADATNPQTKSKYASYAKLDRVLRPIYTKHGISISYGTEDTDKAESVRVIAHVARGGYTRKYQVDMPADGKGAKGGDVMTKTHATGAAIAYGSRYLLKAIFNIAVGEADRDGNATGNKTMPESAKADFLKLLPLCETIGQLEATWQDITKATSAAGDVIAHEELRAAVLQRRRELRPAK